MEKAVDVFADRSSQLYAEKFEPLTREIAEIVKLFVYIDGRFLKAEEAKISVWDHGLLYGDGVFEGIRVYDGNIFKLDAHLDRLYNSAKGLKIENIPLTKEELKAVIVKTVSMNGLKDAHVRPIITRGVGGPNLDPRVSPRPSIIVIGSPYPPPLGHKPIRMIVSTVRRKSPFSVDSQVKSLNYVDNILAKIQANAVGCDEAIMLDFNGFVAEGTGQNIFVVKSNRLYTPHVSAALPGITRATVVDLAGEIGVDVVETNLTPQDLYVSNEAFLTGTAAEIVPIGEVDGRTIGDGTPGLVTTKLMKMYRETTKKKFLTPAY